MERQIETSLRYLSQYGMIIPAPERFQYLLIEKSSADIRRGGQADAKARVNGASAQEYREKAAAFFKERDLQVDLAELNRELVDIT